MKSAVALAAAMLGTAGAQYDRQVPLYSTYNFDPLHHLSGIAPYFEPADPPRQPAPPQGCTVTRAAYLVRHAAINANDFDYEEYLQPFLEKLGNSSVDWSHIPGLAFLAGWTPPSFGEQELLTRTGRLEAATLGVSLSYRYPTLRLPQRVWSSTAERTVESAKGFIRGLRTDDDDTINLVQVPQGKKEGADSLTPYSSCPGYKSDSGADQQDQYIDTYTAPIIARLHALAPDFNFTANDVTAMQELCGYETVVRGSSAFCDTPRLFTPDEWLQFEYGQDVHYHYNVGYGNNYAGAIGFPWVNATMGLLTADTAEQDMYVSFTHRELPPTVLVALGLFNNSEFSGANDPNATMPLDRVNYNRAWITSYILPFLTNVAIERMNCTANYGSSATAAATASNATNSGSNSTYSDNDAQDPTYFRVLVNQSPQVLPGCSDGPGQSCSAAGLQQFLSQREAMFGGFSQRCGVTYSNSTDVVSFYTDSNNGTTVSKRSSRRRMAA